MTPLLKFVALIVNQNPFKEHSLSITSLSLCVTKDKNAYLSRFIGYLLQEIFFLILKYFIVSLPYTIFLDTKKSPTPFME